MHWIDPEHLPPVSGKIDRFICNFTGQYDGFILMGANDNLSLVDVPPHLGTELKRTFRLGDFVVVRGVRPRRADLIAAISIEGSDGKLVVDSGPPKERSNEEELATRPVSVSATVRLTLFSPKGEPRGAILDDGTVLRLGPKEASQWIERLKPGAVTAARGHAIEAAGSLVVQVEEIAAEHDPFTRSEGLKPARPSKHDADRLRRDERPPQTTEQALA
jgi:hypothetical protein